MATKDKLAEEESLETAAEEKDEISAKQKKEKEAGYDEKESENVKIPEEIQKECHALINKCENEQCLEYIRTTVRHKEDELRKDELRKAKMKEENKGKNKVPNEYSTVGMPSSY